MEKKKHSHEAIGGLNSPNEFLRGIKSKRLTATEVMIKDRDLKKMSEEAMLDLFKGGLEFSQKLDRIERMLKYLVIQKQLEINHQDRLTAGEMQNKEWFEACVEGRKKIRKQVPDISDIIKEE